MLALCFVLFAAITLWSAIAAVVGMASDNRKDKGLIPVCLSVSVAAALLTFALYQVIVRQVTL